MCKSDRELLELAAKAGEIHIIHNSYADGFGFTARYFGGWWNPLTDDGDALRLAVKVGIHIRHWVYACEAEDNDGRNTGMIYSSDCGDDMCAATRRAIVLAAAAIGEAM